MSSAIICMTPLQSFGDNCVTILPLRQAVFENRPSGKIDSVPPVAAEFLMNIWSHARFLSITLLASFIGLSLACSSSKTPDAARATPQAVNEGTCQIQPTNAGTTDDDTADAGADSADNPDTPNYLSELGCLSDFEALASLPLDVTLPGVRSMKYVIDTQDVNAPNNIRLYFQNTERYALHVQFCSKNIKGVIADSSFNNNYYGSSDRRFMLGSISYYEKPNIWALELAAYDTSTAAMIEKLFDTITPDKAFFRPALAFHPTSDALAKVANQLDMSIPVVTTEDIYGKTDYQPLVRATAMGVLTFLTASEVNSGSFIPYNSIVVLDEAPNDITVVAGIITAQFQSPLSHINVLANNRKTPNMGLRSATSNPALLEYRNQWVQLTVGADDYEVVPVDPAVGEAYFEAHRPAPVVLPPIDLTETRIQDIEALVPNFLAINSDPNTKQADVLKPLKKAVNAYGGKSANYSVLAQTANVPVAKAFAIPIYYYDKFMRDNGIYDMIDGFLNDVDVRTQEATNFTTDPIVREQALRDVRNTMMKGQLDPDLQNQLKAKITKDFTGTDGKPIIMRFRTSTNSEDLAAFPCAGCYNSESGDPSNWQSVWDGIIKAYTTAWLFRTFEERSYYGVDQHSVGMGLLVHHKFINEVANGVAITANPYDLTQSDSAAYYINVAYGGDNAVVALPAGVTSDQFLYQVGAPGTPIVPISSTNQPLPANQMTVLSVQQVAALGKALTAVKTVFQKAYYDSGSNWYAMDCEFKFAAVDSIGNITNTPVLWLKQARPYPNPNGDTGN